MKLKIITAIAAAFVNLSWASAQEAPADNRPSHLRDGFTRECNNTPCSNYNDTQETAQISGQATGVASSHSNDSGSSQSAGATAGMRIDYRNGRDRFRGSLEAGAVVPVNAAPAAPTFVGGADLRYTYIDSMTRGTELQGAGMSFSGRSQFNGANHLTSTDVGLALAHARNSQTLFTLNTVGYLRDVANGREGLMSSLRVLTEQNIGALVTIDAAVEGGLLYNMGRSHRDVEQTVNGPETAGGTTTTWNGPNERVVTTVPRSVPTQTTTTRVQTGEVQTADPGYYVSGRLGITLRPMRNLFFRAEGIAEATGYRTAEQNLDNSTQAAGSHGTISATGMLSVGVNSN